MGTAVQARLVILCVVGAVLLVGFAGLIVAPPDAAASGDEFAPIASDPATVVFGAVGDFDNKAPNYVDMVALAKRLGNRGGMFLLALGDLGYVADEQQWCGVIKGAFNNTLVVAGNHDTTESGPGDINNDVIYCPFNVDAALVPGPTYGYGKSYYFDYPRTGSLVRVIMITAGTSGTQVSGQNYAPGGAEYNWVVGAVTSARNASIPWVVVGLHKMCITVGSKTSCEMGQKLFDKLVDLKVDLFLQGHDHTYQRSKLLALSANCPSVLSGGQFDPDCVVASGPNFVKGNGSIVAIDGAGGRDLYTVHIDGSDKEIGYFDAVMGTNVNTEGKSNGHGSLLVTLNATSLTGTTTFCPLGTGDPTTGECPSKVNTTFSDTFTISSVETPPPPVGADFTFSPSNPIRGQTVTFTGTASGGTPPYTYAWEFGDRGTGSGASTTHVYSNEGSYAVNLTVTDAASGTVSVSKTVTVTAPPPLSADFTFNPSSPNAGQSVTFSASASGGTPPYGYAWEFGDGSTGSGATVGHVYATAGSYVANLTVTDSEPATASASHTVVVAPPPALAADFTFSPTGPQVGQTVTFTASAMGGTPPYAYAWQFGDGATGSGATATHAFTAEGRYVVNLTVTDTASDTANASKDVVVFAPPPPGSPVASFRFNPTWPQSNATVSFDASSSSDPGNLSLEYRWDWTDDGSFDTGWSTDAAATHAYAVPGVQVARLEVRNSAALTDNATASVPVDGAAPVTTVSLSGTLGQNGWYRGSVTVTLTPTDDVSGVTATWIRRDNASWNQGTATTFTNDRVHTVDYYSIDRSGRIETTRTILVPLDGTPPATSSSLQGTPNPNGSYRFSVNVTLSASDGLSGVGAASYRVDNGSWQTYTALILVTGAGTHAVAYYATDVAGNDESVKSVAFAIWDAPSGSGGPPVTTLSFSGTFGSGGWYTSSVSVTLTATSPDGLATTIYYRLDGNSWNAYSVPFTVLDGVHTLEYNATDAASRREVVHSTTLSVDTGSPTTSATLTGTRGRDHWFTSDVAVALSATDPVSGVAATSYRLDSGSWQSYASPFTVRSGRHTLEYRSTDAAGNIESVISASLRIDTSPPKIRLVPLPAVLTVSSVAVSWNETDDVAGIMENEVVVDGVPFADVGTNLSAVLSLPDGAHTIRVMAMDDAGNVALVEASVVVDTNPFSPNGPYGGVPLYFLVEAIVVVVVALAWRRRSRKKRLERERAARWTRRQAR